MNIAVKKDGQDVEFKYSTETVVASANTQFVFHKWTNDNYKVDGETPIFFGSKPEDAKNPDVVKAFYEQAEKKIIKLLDITV